MFLRKLLIVSDGGIQFSARRPALPTDVCHVILQYPETSTGIVFEDRLRLPPATSFLIPYDLTVVSINTISSELLIVSINEGLCCMELVG